MASPFLIKETQKNLNDLTILFILQESKAKEKTNKSDKLKSKSAQLSHDFGLRLFLPRVRRDRRFPGALAGLFPSLFALLGKLLGT